MIVADYLDYDTAEIYDQGKSKTCTAHAFFTLLAEHIQQDTGKELEFDFQEHFDYMEKYRWKNIEKVPSIHEAQRLLRKEE